MASQPMDLDHHYSPSRWSHRMGADEVIKAHIKSLKDGSEAAKQGNLDCEIGFPYGESENERLDIFGAQTLPGGAPIFVYIHGGYWQDLSREMSSFMATTFCRAGAVVAAIGYELAPKVNMAEIIRQVTKAVSFVLTMATRRGSSGVYLCGHSAGGHLAAMMLAHNWMDTCMVGPSLIRGAVLVSGVYDLTPIVSTYVNKPLKMSKSDAVQHSPITHIDNITQYSQNRRILVAFGDHDPPEFQRQSTEFNTSLIQGGIHSAMMIVPDCDHFNVIENLQKEDYILTQETLRIMGLNVGNILETMDKASISN
ncbi:kynurenine formamidase-like [Mya arenaria]|uniref:kynurenine formamidase-like n=1 Tax=Mya arenaria TaxID=6604 RepID=UPI0022E8C5BB|nr:kynurenine formamidase-like [Mya arenaria]